MSETADQTFEWDLWNSGIEFVAGIDEVGRGPLAGPVTACAVIFAPGAVIDGVTDSKKLSAVKREKLAKAIKTVAITYAFGWASVEEIDRINIRQATFLAMRRAVSQLNPQPGHLLVDGEALPDAGIDTTGIVSGDRLSFSIAAASILAKVERDAFMVDLHKKYSNYAFDSNKGYGSKAHIEAIRNSGPCEFHRRTFLRKILGEHESTTVKKQAIISGRDLSA